MGAARGCYFAILHRSSVERPSCLTLYQIMVYEYSLQKLVICERSLVQMYEMAWEKRIIWGCSLGVLIHASGAMQVFFGL